MLKQVPLESHEEYLELYVYLGHPFALTSSQ